MSQHCITDVDSMEAGDGCGCDVVTKNRVSLGAVPLQGLS